MNILIVRLSSIGDVVHALPAVGQLKDHFRGCRISWVAEEVAAQLLEGYAGIDRVIVFHRRQWLKALRRLRLIQAAALTRCFLTQLRRERYDLILDFQGLLKSGVIVGCARGKRKLGFQNSREGSRVFYSEKAPPPPPQDHAIRRQMSLIRCLGIAERPPNFSKLYGPQDEAALRRVLRQEGVDTAQPLVCVHACARWATKLWPLERAAALCQRLQQEYGCRVLLVGSAADRERTDRIAALAGGCARSLAGRTGLGELACLLPKAELMISMDSGPMHMACASGTPGVALFGPTSPGRTGPFGENWRVIQKALACSPCFARGRCPEGHHRCMANITVEEVLEACAQIAGARLKKHG